MAERVRVGIVGYGYAGEVIHAPLIAAAPGLELVAASTSRPDRQELARGRGLRVHAKASELIANDDVDLVVIATPHDTHLPLTREACAAGRHVVCDKLMALDVDEARSMLVAAQEAGVMLSVFHNRRWDGDFLTVRQALGLDRSGPLKEIPDIGTLIRIHAWVHGSGAPNPAKWRAQRSHGGGIFSDWGAHLVDQALQLHEQPVSTVSCQMSRAVPEIDVESAALCVVGFADGSGHVIETTQLYHESSKGYEVWGTRGRLRITGFDPRENLLNQEVRGTERSPGDYEVLFIGPHGTVELGSPGPGDWAAYYRNVAAHLIRDEQLAVTPESVVRMMELREAALRSAAEGRTVEGPI
ncbi:MAG: Gfo/Idh/MocA family protein [bacterium]